MNPQDKSAAPVSRRPAIAAGRFAWVGACVIAAIVVLFYGWVAIAARCGEVCDPASSAWQEDSGSWQWTAQLLVVALSAAAFATSAGLTVRRRPLLAFAAAIVGLGIAVYWFDTVIPHVSTS